MAPGAAVPRNSHAARLRRSASAARRATRAAAASRCSASGSLAASMRVWSSALATPAPSNSSRSTRASSPPPPARAQQRDVTRHDADVTIQPLQYAAGTKRRKSTPAHCSACSAEQGIVAPAISQVRGLLPFQGCTQPLWYYKDAMPYRVVAPLEKTGTRRYWHA